ncbi:MAG: methylenetetrahydrofolate--tRNA-(uracil(54)-C(5))-methyltransferase (FADH(2)-oxidizing) TrmFO [Erysipelotrichaceae bacterium]|nr:methylenetetrahydrofolate--tRNA-(uracil(54)-C(5))-methyltransferase (FADH(2)-oxidizing) TrmFO [Erysipelotrichaceae bacterium]
MMEKHAVIIGAGLAGCEAAYQLTRRGIAVDLYEMKPVKKTPAHSEDTFAELVCSNSLKNEALTNACGLLKQEMRTIGSLILDSAEHHKVPAGAALAVDREGFSAEIDAWIRHCPLITIHEEEVTEIPAGPCIIATGPLTSDGLMTAVKQLFPEEDCYFYDAEAPIVTRESIDFSIAYRKSRYDRGEADYINCPMTEAEFDSFYDALMKADTVPLHSFEKEVYFEGCMPFEVMARRGKQTLLYGPMKPVGLRKPDGTRPYAVVQLRQDDAADTMYNIVGFQTHLTWGAQKQVLRMIPGLQNAEFVRYGVMHRNTYLNAPKHLLPTFQTKVRPDLFFAGQITGVEGYVESAASGMLAGINLAHLLKEEPLETLSNDTMLGSLTTYITQADPEHFQPMNANFGIMHLNTAVKKADRKEAYAKQSLPIIEEEVRNGRL